MDERENTVNSEHIFPADLTKEEFTDFYMAMSRTNGPLRMQKPTVLFLGIYMLMSIVLFVCSSVQNGTLDWELLLIVLCMAVLCAVLLPLLPRRVRKNAQLLYEQGSDNGYYGLVHLYETGIFKETESGTVQVPFSPTSSYLEDEGFMAFFARGSERAIVLPARCLTQEDADLLRRRVFASTVTMQQRVIRRMIPRASAHIAQREISSAVQTPLLTLDFEYTREELEKLTADTGLHRYIRSLPVTAVMSVMMGLLVGALAENVPVGGLTAVGTLLLYLAAATVFPRFRVRRALNASPQTARLCVSFSDGGISFHAGSGGQKRSFAWERISRAVERKGCVEFFCGTGVLRIPKRCIPDMEELRAVVDAHMPKAGASK